MSDRVARSEPLRIFIGYDSREPIAYHVLAHSILSRASIPVMIAPLTQSALRASGLYTRERASTESTEFSLTRFLIPALCGYRGHAIFMDCDMLCLTDMADIVNHIDEQPRAVLVCQHDYQSHVGVKFLGQVNLVYPRKNWSSFMVFDTTRCRALTPSYVNEATGLQLHRFQWTTDDAIGSLPLEWNWLVGEYPPNAEAKVLHYTLGGPWFAGYAACDHADLWRAELASMTGMAVKVA